MSKNADALVLHNAFFSFQVAPYERPALSKAYLFPEGKQFIFYLLNAILVMSFNYLGFLIHLYFLKEKLKKSQFHP